MRNCYWSAALCVAFGLALTGQSLAAVTVTADPSVTATTTSITGFQTEGDDMVGMLVTAHFSDGSSQAVNWAATGPSAGAAVGTDWSLAESGNTFAGTWTLTNNTGLSLVRLVLDGAPGRTVFDRTFGFNDGTPASFAGIDFVVTGGLGSDDILATYRHILAIPPASAVGDLFVILDLQWTNNTSFGSGRTLTFVQDTDNASTAIEVVIPEPASLALFLTTGIAGVVASRYRRSRTKAA